MFRNYRSSISNYNFQRIFDRLKNCISIKIKKKKWKNNKRKKKNWRWNLLLVINRKIFSNDRRTRESSGRRENYEDSDLRQNWWRTKNQTKTIWLTNEPDNDPDEGESKPVAFAALNYPRFGLFSIFHGATRIRPSVTNAFTLFSRRKIFFASFKFGWNQILLNSN